MTSNNRIRLVAVSIIISLGFVGAVSGSDPLHVAPFLELQARYGDNVLRVPRENRPTRDLAVLLWTGVDTKVRLGEKTQLAARYEAAPRWYMDHSDGNRHDHLLSLVFHRRLRPALSLLSTGNLGLRSQSNDPIQEYFKQDISGQLHAQWNRRWSSQFGLQVRSKLFPKRRSADYASLMAEAKLRRRLGLTSTLSAGYQARIYEGALDPRVLVSELNRGMEGFRQSANVWFESMLLGRLLTHWRYRFEVDSATRELQHHELLPSEFLRIRDFDEDEGEYDVDFNFVTHRLATLWIWRVSDRSILSLSARHHLKRFRDWPVPGQNVQRRDNLTLIRLAAKQKLTSLLSARLEYLFEGNRSNDADQRYTTNSVSAQFQVEF